MTLIIATSDGNRQWDNTFITKIAEDIITSFFLFERPLIEAKV